MVDISVIIPTHNAERYIISTIKSVLNQNFAGSLEIIIVDDCSKDNTVNIIQDFIKKENDGISLYQLPENKKQGVARNIGLSHAKGKYVMFLDSDDFLDHSALSIMFEKAETYNCDFVLCDWIQYHEDKGFVYTNQKESFLHRDLLEGPDCETVLETITYFTVNKLYLRQYLLEHDILYGEGYIYEDYEFFVDVAQKAQRIGIINQPLYNVRIHPQSTTKSNRDTMIHVHSFLCAVEATLQKFSPRKHESYYHVHKYILRKCLNYTNERAPKGMKRKVLKKTVQLLNGYKDPYIVPTKITLPNHFYFRKQYVRKQKINHILFIDFLHRNNLLSPLLKVKSKIKKYFV